MGVARTQMKTVRIKQLLVTFKPACPVAGAHLSFTGVSTTRPTPAPILTKISPAKESARALDPRAKILTARRATEKTDCRSEMECHLTTSTIRPTSRVKPA
jgi:hypothetical protein